ncbi:Low temperature viability protein-domain-containing protein [Choanephora cucurbitarum]|nr:Low temperature viability protein-domain-containing protein [Choanephora cucurbitarum]
MGKKPFIDKKSAKHFHVVHRSQKDPLINDTEASDRVLQEVLPLNQLKHKSQAEIDRVKTKPTKMTQDEIDQRIGQAAQYGIFFDDGEYDYMQHLRTMGDATDAVFLEAPKKEKARTLEDGFLKKDLDLPSSVLPSNVEMNVGVMNQQTGLDNGLQPDMDPRLREVLEALEDEEYVENDLDDDFFESLNAEGDFEDEEEDYVDYSDDDDEEEEDMPPPKEGEAYDWQAAFQKFKLQQSRQNDSDDEDDLHDRYTQQTGFSVSSSAMHRNSQLRLLDDRFERIEEEYAEDDDDEEDVYNSDGELKEERADFEAILDDFLDKYEIVGRKMQPKMDGESSAAKLDTVRQGLVKPEVVPELERVRLTQAVLEPKLERPVQKQRETWDVQTVISTYSNLENHPSLISDRGPSKRIRIDPKTGMPVLVEVPRKQPKEEEEEEEEESESEEEAENKGVARSKKESKEEKKARKQAVKEAKKVMSL